MHSFLFLYSNVKECCTFLQTLFRQLHSHVMTQNSIRKLCHTTNQFIHAQLWHLEPKPQSAKSVNYVAKSHHRTEMWGPSLPGSKKLLKRWQNDFLALKADNMSPDFVFHSSMEVLPLFCILTILNIPDDFGSDHMKHYKELQEN